MKKVLAVFSIILILMLLCSCLPKATIDSASHKLNSVGYEYTVDEHTIPSLIKVKTGISPIFLIYGFKGDELIYAFSFQSEEDAVTAKDYVTTWANSIMDNPIVKQKGEWVYFGTEQGVKDFQ